MTGQLIAVVGPSGAGKDTVLDAICAARPTFRRVRRVITRPSSAGGEAFDGVTRAEFARRAAMGEFALSWEAHGLSYGIPADQLRALDEGITLLFNGSRGMMEEARAAFPHLKVLLITARDEVLAQRLAERGRESASEISERLSRARMSAPTGAHVIEIDNSGALDQAVAAALAALEPVRG